MNNKAFLLIFSAGMLFVSCKLTPKESPSEQGIVEDTQVMVGNDADGHGCRASAGYTWSVVRNDCIRLFESGIRLEATEGETGSAFIVFSTDSLQAELFFSNGDASEVLDRRSLPAGGYAWNVEDDDTKNVRLIDSAWTISQRGNVRYTQETGKMETATYEGLLPAADCPGIRYKLTIKHREHSGDGTFVLDQTYLEAEDGKDITFTATGRRYTLRGDATDKNATVWQLKSDDDDEIFNFLVEDGGEKLTLLNQDFQKADSDLNYSITRVK